MMKTFRGFDDACGCKLIGYGKWTDSYDELKATYEEVKKETGSELTEITLEDDTTSNDFDDWYNVLTENRMTFCKLRIAMYATDGELLIADDDTCGGFEDDYPWDENDNDRWENDYE